MVKIPHALLDLLPFGIAWYVAFRAWGEMFRAGLQLFQSSLSWLTARHVVGFRSSVKPKRLWLMGVPPREQGRDEDPVSPVERKGGQAISESLKRKAGSARHRAGMSKCCLVGQPAVSRSSNHVAHRLSHVHASQIPSQLSPLTVQLKPTCSAGFRWCLFPSQGIVADILVTECFWSHRKHN